MDAYSEVREFNRGKKTKEARLPPLPDANHTLLPLCISTGAVRIGPLENNIKQNKIIKQAVQITGLQKEILPSPINDNNMEHTFGKGLCI